MVISTNLPVSYEFSEENSIPSRRDTLLKAVAVGVAILAVIFARPLIANRVAEAESARIENWAKTEHHRVETECMVENFDRPAN